MARDLMEGGFIMESRKNAFLEYFQVRPWRFFIPIAFFAIYDSGFNSFSSILASLAAAFPDAPKVVIQMVLTAPSLLCIPSSLLVGIAAAYIRKKVLIEIAIAIMLCGGLLPVVSSWFMEPSIYVLFASSALIGLAQGAMNPLGSALVMECYQGGQASKVFGFKQAANYLGAAVFSLSVGYLALFHWSNAYLVYLGLIPVFIISALGLPKGEKDAKVITTVNTKEAVLGLLNSKTLYLLVIFSLATVLSFAWHANISMMIADKGLGSSADVSKITSMNYVIAFCIGLAYGKLTNVLKRFTLIASFALLAIGMLVASIGEAFSVILIGGALVGMGQAILEVTTLNWMSHAVGKKYVTLILSITMACINLSIGFSPLLITALRDVFFAGGGPAQSLLVAAGGYGVLLIADLLYRIFVNRTWSGNSEMVDS